MYSGHADSERYLELRADLHHSRWVTHNHCTSLVGGLGTYYSVGDDGACSFVLHGGHCPYHVQGCMSDLSIDSGMCSQRALADHTFWMCRPF